MTPTHQRVRFCGTPDGMDGFETWVRAEAPVITEPGGGFDPRNGLPTPWRLPVYISNILGTTLIEVRADRVELLPEFTSNPPLVRFDDWLASERARLFGEGVEKQ